MCERLSVESGLRAGEVDLYSEQYEVRDSAKRNLFTGKTYNSVDNISQFFAERGMPPPAGLTRRPEQGKLGLGVHNPEQAKPPAPPAPPPQAPARAISPPRGIPPRTAKPKSGAVVNHPKYGRGTVLRREGDGDDAKLTISFPGHGLKKIVEKYAGIKSKNEYNDSYRQRRT